MARNKSQTRTIQVDLKTREAAESSDKYIEGYFSIFNQETEILHGAFEEIDRNAIKEINDVRALINHDSTLVIGRTKAGTLELKCDNYGLFGRIKINQDDTDALNIYSRVQRGDVDQCSFGFIINEELVDARDDGSVKWTVTDLELLEVSICTFPAYEDTSVSAREKQFAQIKDKKIESRKKKLLERLKGEKNA